MSTLSQKYHLGYALTDEEWDLIPAMLEWEKDDYIELTNIEDEEDEDDYIDVHLYVIRGLIR